MNLRTEPFVPPAPMPKSTMPSGLEVVRTVFRNPLELWRQPAYALPWIDGSLFGQQTIIANDPDLIRHILVDNAANYKMATVRQLVLRPILQDGLLTAEGDVWKRSRKAMAPVFTPRHAHGFADQMLKKAQEFVVRYEPARKAVLRTDLSTDMTRLTFEILSETLFSGDIADITDDFASDVDNLLHSMGRVDPMDLLMAPSWVPRLTRLRGKVPLAKFRALVLKTMELRLKKLDTDPTSVPNDFLTLLLGISGPDGLTMGEIEDNILTFIGAGHETTARGLAWTLYCVANTPDFRERMEAEIDQVIVSGAPPVQWLELMPHVRAAFEEALRLYPPAPSINREPIEDDEWTDSIGNKLFLAKGANVLVMPWTLHRHTLYWENPNAYTPERFLPHNRNKIGRFQFLPFGVGPRTCIGATFALQEAVIALAVLMSQFRFDMAPDTNPWPVQKLTVQPANGLPMLVSARPSI